MTLTEVASLFNLSGIAVVLVLSLVMLWRHPSPFYRAWTSAYGAMFAVLAFDILGGHFGRTGPMVALHAAAALTTAGFLYRVFRMLRGSTFDLRLIAASALAGAAATGVATAAGLPFHVVIAPVAFLIVAGNLALGLTLIFPGKDGNPAPLLGIPFFLTGLLIFTYPALMLTPYFWLGYWAMGLLNVLVGVGMTVYLLEAAYARLQAQHEQLLRLEQLKRSFLSTVSHELRTPLTGMVGNLELLEDGIGGPLSPAQEAYVREVQRGATQLSELVESLLDTAQMEAGAFRVKREAVDLNVLLPQARQAIAGWAAQKRLNLELSVEAELPLVQGDALRLSQVMSNLLSNAVKFTPEGGTLRITAAASPEGVSVTVSDTGIGIPVSALPHVFEPFFQVDSGLTRQHRGSGLGLPIVKTLVEAMGGTIVVSSQPAQGSTFRVTMPLADVACVPLS